LTHNTPHRHEHKQLSSPWTLRQDYASASRTATHVRFPSSIPPGRHLRPESLGSWILLCNLNHPLSGAYSQVFARSSVRASSSGSMCVTTRASCRAPTVSCAERCTGARSFWTKGFLCYTHASCSRTGSISEANWVTAYALPHKQTWARVFFSPSHARTEGRLHGLPEGEFLYTMRSRSRGPRVKDEEISRGESCCLEPLCTPCTNFYVMALNSKK
jgi:hypothetical protein